MSNIKSIKIYYVIVVSILLLAFSGCLFKGKNDDDRKLSFQFNRQIQNFLQDTTRVNAFVDSLKHELKEARYDTLAIIQLSEIASNLKEPLNFIFVNEAIEKSDVINFKYGKLYGLLNLSQCYEKANKYTIADSILGLCLKEASENNFKVLRFESLHTLGRFRVDRNNYPEAIGYFEKALELSKKMRDTSRISICLSDIGQSYYYLNDFKRALGNLFKARELNKGSNLVNEINIVGRIGQTYYMMDDYSSALKYYLVQLKLALEVNDQIAAARTYGLIGELYRLLDDYQRAIDYYEWSLKKAIELKDMESIGFTYNCLGEVYYVQKKYDKALGCFEKAMAMSLNHDDKLSYAYALNMAGIVYTEKGNPSMGLVNHKKALQLFVEANDFVSATTAKVYLSTDYLELKDYSRSKQYIDSAIVDSKRYYSADNLKDCYLNYSRIYERTGKPQNSLDAYKLYIAYRDSLFNNEKSKSFASVELNERENQLKAEQERKEAVHKAERMQQEEALKREKLIKYCLSIGAFLLVLLAFVIFRSLKESRRSKKIIEHQKEEVEEQKKLIEEKNKEVLDSINYAKRIQYALLAHQELLNRYIPDHFVLFKPKDIVSGDFYWATVRNDKFYLAVCDSTGHGVPGAFMSLLNIGFLSEAINEKNIEKPNEVFNYVRKRLIESLSQDERKDGMDGILVCFDLSTKHITYAAANNAPVLVSDNLLVNLQKNKMPVGKGETLDDFELFNLNYKKGDTFYLFTDGYADQFGGPKGKKFKYKQLENALLESNSESLENQQMLLTKRIMEWKGVLEQVDDILVIGVKL